MSARFTPSFARRCTVRLLAGCIVLALLLSGFAPALGMATKQKLSLGSTALGNPGDENWAAEFYEEGTNDVVRALALDEAGNLYAGGEFTTANGVAANHIARWDGVRWSALGSGTDGSVYALAVDGDGNLYAAGWFTTAGGVAVNNIAKWNGTGWSALGSGISGYVYALAFDSIGNLYVGGGFWYAGGIPARFIAKWDGSNWSALGNGAQGMGEGINALVIDGNDDVYAGGYFWYYDDANNVIVSCLGKWDGSKWSAIDNGGAGAVRSLAADGDSILYVGHEYITHSAGSIAKWDATTLSWTTLGNVASGGVLALAVDRAGSLYAGGAFSSVNGIAAKAIAKWDGISWSALGTGVATSDGYNTRVEALAVERRGNLYVSALVTS